MAQRLLRKSRIEENNCRIRFSPGSRLLLLRGDPVRVPCVILKDVNMFSNIILELLCLNLSFLFFFLSHHVFLNAFLSGILESSATNSTEPYSLARDKQVKDFASLSGIEVFSPVSHTLFNPAVVIGKEKQLAREQLQDTAQLWNHALSFLRSMSLKCAIELGIPDVLHNHGKPITLSELATSLSIPPSKAPALGSLMRLLVHSGLFASHRDQEGGEEESYFLTPASKLLVKEKKACLSPFALMILNWTLLAPAHQLGAWFRAGAARATPFDMAHGKGFFEETNARADFNELFNEGMASDARLVTEVAVGRRQWEVLHGVRSVVDVGGGTGTLAKAIAKAFPGVRCAVLDLPHVVATVDEEEREGVEFIGGDMFEHIPPADAVLFKWILHDWSDGDCIRILNRCKEAIPPKKDGGKVIIIDMVVGVTTDVSISVEPQLLFDMEMMILCTGKERSETEWSRLFHAAGFSDYKITASMGLRSVIELYN